MGEVVSRQVWRGERLEGPVGPWIFSRDRWPQEKEKNSEEMEGSGFQRESYRGSADIQLKGG